MLVPDFAKAQTFTARPIKLVEPFSPGGLINTMAKLVSASLALEHGQPVVIDNKPGAGGNLSAAEVARSAPDGYTLLISSPSLTSTPALYAAMPYKPKKITTIRLLGRVANVRLVKAKSMQGELNYASDRKGASLHLSAELFKSSTGTFITHIPYWCAAQAVTKLLAGKVDMMFGNLPPVIGQIQDGSVKALAVTTRTRSKKIASVPTLAESSLRDFDVGLLNAQLMGAFISADAAKWTRVASFAKIALSGFIKPAQVNPAQRTTSVSHPRSFNAYPTPTHVKSYQRLCRPSHP